jgi:DNA-binding MarR family transcriptional regulator
MSRKKLQLEAFLPYRLSLLTNVVSSAIASQYAERFSLSIPEWRVMAVLAQEPGLSAAEVAERTAMDKVAVSRAVAALQRMRRLERQLARGDRRRSVLRLSEAGFAVYREVAPVALAYEDALLQPLSARDRAELDRLLELLTTRAATLQPTSADATPPPRRRL